MGGSAKKRNVVGLLLDDEVPMEQRCQVLEQLVAHGSDESRTVLGQLLEAAAGKGAQEGYEHKVRELQETIDALEQGPVRVGTYIGTRRLSAGPPRAEIRLEDGSTVLPVVRESTPIEALRRGDGVLLDAQAKLLIAVESGAEVTGEEAELERRIDDHRVEVALRGDERHVFDAAQPVVDALDAGELAAGGRLLVCSRRRFALCPLPAEEGPGYYRFLDRRPVPDVRLERDLGSPPAYIAEILRQVRVEMTEPERRRRYRLPRCILRLLHGITGSGKSFSLLALERAVYQLMAEVTGVAISDLPRRVMRLRSSQVLSMWLGESDKNLARFMAEIERLASETLVGADGHERELPVLVVLEEIDGLTRTRGQDTTYDRILTTLLELLDPAREELRDRLLVFVATTNVAPQIDLAFLRRIGGSVERFGRLDRTAFRQVLARQLDGRPLAASDDCDPEMGRRRLVGELTSWLFSPNGEDPGQVELSLVGSSEPEIRYRRDFLTAGLVGRAVEQAAQAACDAEEDGGEHPGVTADGLKLAFHQQVRGLVGVLRSHNIGDYLELAEGVRVQGVRPIEQPPSLACELMTA